MLRPALDYRLLVGIAAAFIIDGCNGETVESPAHANLAATLAALDLEGSPVHPLRDGRARFVLFLFTRTDCPISNRYAPEVRRLHERFAPLGVEFLLVYPASTDAPEEIRDHLTAFEYPCRALRDPAHALVRFTGATVTPEAALVARSGELLYRGRIDDRFPDYGAARQRSGRRELEEALAAATSDRPVPTPRTEAVGCPIPDLRAGRTGK